MPTIGWNHKVGKDTIISAQNWGNSGANQTYTFTNFQTMLYDTIMYKALTTGQQTTFPGADVAATTDDLNFIFTKTFATNYKWIGIQGILGSCNVNAGIVNNLCFINSLHSLAAISPIIPAFNSKLQVHALAKL